MNKIFKYKAILSTGDGSVITPRTGKSSAKILLRDLPTNGSNMFIYNNEKCESPGITSYIEKIKWITKGKSCTYTDACGRVFNINKIKKR